jgi:hypothetical protein
MIHEGHIDLNPSYQRGNATLPGLTTYMRPADIVTRTDVVWPDSKQVGLIDSLFRNFYVPPVVFAVTTDEDGATIRICVDGKQVC